MRLARWCAVAVLTLASCSSASKRVEGGFLIAGVAAPDITSFKIYFDKSEPVLVVPTKTGSVVVLIPHAERIRRIDFFSSRANSVCVMRSPETSFAAC